MRYLFLIIFLVGCDNTNIKRDNNYKYTFFTANYGDFKCKEMYTYNWGVQLNDCISISGKTFKKIYNPTNVREL